MNSVSQMIFNFTSIFITVTLIVGITLISIALFRITAALKFRNKMLQQATRPYLFCQRHLQQLKITNIGAVPIIIDKIDSNSDFSSLIGQKIMPNQALFYQITENTPMSLTIGYHDQITTYYDEFNI